MYRILTFTFWKNQMGTQAEPKQWKLTFRPCNSLQTHAIVIFICMTFSGGCSHEKHKNMKDSSNESRRKGVGLWAFSKEPGFECHWLLIICSILIHTIGQRSVSMRTVHTNWSIAYKKYNGDQIRKVFIVNCNLKQWLFEHLNPNHHKI